MVIQKKLNSGHISKSMPFLKTKIKEFGEVWNFKNLNIPVYGEYRIYILFHESISNLFQLCPLGFLLQLALETRVSSLSSPPKESVVMFILCNIYTVELQLMATSPRPPLFWPTVHTLTLV